jgi:hypothetical protein
MIQSGNLTFACATELVRGRFVTITAATDTVAYTAGAAAADGITIGDSENGVVAVQLLKDVSKSFWFEAAGTLAIGDDVEVGADGKGVVQNAGATVCIAKTAGVAGSFVTGYNK